ncbi:MAG: efflux RND transporter periplasmic adaptor subunit [Gammaproteobacteria bacterium]|nr:efflux RND transporter periplasmic adaptor subunit [Gammaproteobacteria bacterium]
MQLLRIFTIVLLLSPATLLAQGGPPGGRPITVETLVLEPSVLRSTIKAVGTVLADASALLRAEIPGQIVKLHFEDGQPVTRGEPLFSIEATVFEAETNEARANAEQSEAAYTRAKELIDDKLISATDFDTARANYNVSVARLLSSQARLAKTIIRAPFDGFVGLRQINIGDYATIGQELVSVVRLDPLRVEFSVPETRLAQIKAGQEISVTVGAYPHEVFEGVIVAIAPQIDVTGHSVSIRAQLPNPELKLRPGLFAQIGITLAVKADALMAPEQAIWPIGQTKTVFVVADGKALQRTVTTGQRKPGWVEITSGLVAGDELVTAGQMKIFGGAAVKTIPATGIDK